MAIFTVDPLISPIHLRAKTPKELEKLIIKFNMVNQTQVSIINIYFDGTYHYAWFYFKKEFKQLLTEEMK